VTLDAKQDITVAGSDLSAGKDLTLIGKNLNLDPGTDATQSRMSQDSSQFGVSVALGGAIGNAVAQANQAFAQPARGAIRGWRRWTRHRPDLRRTTRIKLVRR
jgi:filamentous hemagglutinin